MEVSLKTYESAPQASVVGAASRPSPTEEMGPGQERGPHPT